MVESSLCGLGDTPFAVSAGSDVPAGALLSNATDPFAECGHHVAEHCVVCNGEITPLAVSAGSDAPAGAFLS